MSLAAETDASRPWAGLPVQVPNVIGGAEVNYPIGDGRGRESHGAEKNRQ